MAFLGAVSGRGLFAGFGGGAPIEMLGASLGSLALVFVAVKVGTPGSVVLTIDTDLLPAPVRLEVPDGATEAFPHVYGPIPVTAVISATPYRHPA